MAYQNAVIANQRKAKYGPKKNPAICSVSCPPMKASHSDMQPCIGHMISNNVFKAMTLETTKLLASLTVRPAPGADVQNLKLFWKHHKCDQLLHSVTGFPFMTPVNKTMEKK
jgi:hypothetical protein